MTRELWGYTTPDNLKRADGRGGYNGNELDRQKRIGAWAAGRFVDAQKQLDPDEEVRAFVESWEQRHRDRINKITRTMIGQQALSGVTLHSLIPVAAGQEDITRTLQLQAQQDADPASWAVRLHVNQVTEEEYTPEIDRTLTAIDNFINHHDSLTVSATYTTYPEALPMGSIRADVWDILLYELSEQSEPIVDKNILGVSGDADPRDLSTNFVSSLQQAAIEYPLTDIFAAHIGWHLEGDPDSAPNKIIGYWSFLRTERQKIIGRFPISETGMAVRLGSYAAAYGFNRLRRDREAADLHQRILTARRVPEEGSERAIFVEDASVFTDSRRIYDTIADGASPHTTWDRKAFKTGEDSVRAADTLTLSQAKLADTTVKSIVLEMEEVYLGRLTAEQAEALRCQGRAKFGLDAFFSIDIG